MKKFLYPGQDERNSGHIFSIVMPLTNGQTVIGEENGETSMKVSGLFFTRAIPKGLTFGY